MTWQQTRALGFSLLLWLGVAHGADETKPSGQAALTLVDYGRESAFSEQSRPGYGRFVVGHFEATAACEVLLIAWNQGSDVLASGWLPALFSLEESQARNAPPKAAAWPWFEPREPFEVTAIFLPRELPDLDELHGVIAQLGDPLLEPALARVLARRLHAQVARWSSASAPASAPARSTATLRGWEQFPWRDISRKVDFAPGQPGVLIFRNPGK